MNDIISHDDNVTTFYPNPCLADIVDDEQILDGANFYGMKDIIKDPIYIELKLFEDNSDNLTLNLSRKELSTTRPQFLDFIDKNKTVLNNFYEYYKKNNSFYRNRTQIDLSFIPDSISKFPFKFIYDAQVGSVQLVELDLEFVAGIVG